MSSIFNTGDFKHRTTLDRNVTTHPGRGARGLLLSIMSQLVEKLMLLLVVVVVLVLIVVKLLIELIDHLTYNPKRHSTSWARCPRITFEYCIPIRRETNVATCRSSSNSASSSKNTYTDLYMTLQTLTNTPKRHS